MRPNVKILFLFALMMVVSLPLMADSIPYSPIGTILAPFTVTATATGTIDAYFAGSSAADEDKVEIKDVTSGAVSGFVFDNQPSTGGLPVGTEMADIISVTAGDTLEFLIENLTTGFTYSSITADSHDSLNHAYVTPYTGSPINICTTVPNTGPYPNTHPIMAGCAIPTVGATYVGLEDLQTSNGGDFDYNNDQFVFTNISATTVPDGGTTASLLGFALAALGLLSRRMK